MAECNPVSNPSCLISDAVSGAASSAGLGFLNDLAKGMVDGLGWVVKNSATFWLNTQSPYLTGQAAMLGRMHHWLFPLVAAIAVAAAIAAGARMAVTRKAAPLLDLTTGLAVMALTAGLGIVLPTVLMKAGDYWTTWILNVSTQGNFDARIYGLVMYGFSSSNTQSVVVIVFGFIALVTSGIQAVLLLFRDAAILTLAAVLPLAASGAIAPATRVWIKKIAAWMLALICYKPAAAAVYATAFTMISDGNGLSAILTGCAMLVLALFALPVLMKFFTWTTGTIGGGSGGGTGQFFGTVASGALTLGAMSNSSGSAATQQANDLRANNPQPANGGPGAGGNTGAGGSSDAGQPGPTGAPGRDGAPGADRPSGANGQSSSSPDPHDSSSPPGGNQPGFERDKARQAPGNDARPNNESSATPPSGAAGTTASAGKSGAASAGAETAAASSAAPWFAAIVAARSLASGAKNTATSAMDEGEQS